MTETVALISEATKTALDETGAATTLAELRDVRVRALGRKAPMSRVRSEMGSLSEDERREIGRLLNEAREQIEAALAAREAELAADEQAAMLARDRIDVTAPGRAKEIGHPHPLSLMVDRIVDIFVGMGFRVAEGPEVETDWYNFQALNIPPDHPARAMHDTFYFPDGRLLRTHTSPVQIRALVSHGAPIAVIAPGRVYRCDSDVTHTPMFHQLEGLVVGENVSFANMRAILHNFVQAFFERDLKMRLRPSYFPFTEPSAEVDMSCVFCGGAGCRICKHTGWLEISGCGMVHPNVLSASGVDPERFTGYAFGMGIDRLAMLRYGVNDLRLLFENDLRLLQQFRAF